MFLSEKVYKATTTKAFSTLPLSSPIPNFCVYAHGAGGASIPLDDFQGWLAEQMCL